MKPTDELLIAALHAASDWPVRTLDDSPADHVNFMSRALHAVLPEIEKRVREQVAAEIRETARSLREDGQISQDGWRGYTAAAYIAGGEPR